jgi:flagellar hook-basal body complex protein FliE
MKLGEVLGSIGTLNNNNLTNNTNQTNVKGNSFANILNNALGDINNSQVKAYDAMESIATGKVNNLQEAVQKIQEAELSLRLGLEVKNKALSAYKQIMSMQV